MTVALLYMILYDIVLYGVHNFYDSYITLYYAFTVVPLNVAGRYIPFRYIILPGILDDVLL